MNALKLRDLRKAIIGVPDKTVIFVYGGAPDAFKPVRDIITNFREVNLGKLAVLITRDPYHGDQGDPLITVGELREVIHGLDDEREIRVHGGDVSMDTLVREIGIDDPLAVVLFRNRRVKQIEGGKQLQLPAGQGIVKK